jgi:hypothetical protein
LNPAKKNAPRQCRALRIGACVRIKKYDDREKMMQDQDHACALGASCRYAHVASTKHGEPPPHTLLDSEQHNAAQTVHNDPVTNRYKDKNKSE